MIFEVFLQHLGFAAFNAAITGRLEHLDSHVFVYDQLHALLHRDGVQIRG